MTIKHYILIAAVAAASASASAQVANYALSLPSGAIVNCGPMSDIDGIASYTMQMWICPDQWTPGAVVAGRGNSLSLSLGQSEGTLVFAVGDKNLDITSSDIKTGMWAQLTLVCDNGASTALVNGEKAGEGLLPAIPSANDNFVLGGKFSGRLDELRIWNIALPDQFNRFINTTLNVYNPLWENLVAYYKMDQNLCPNLVDYKSVETPDAEYNNHGILCDGASRTLVEDNSGLPYLINGAYTANERFYDRAISREQYLLSNDLIILGVEFVENASGLLDGHVQTVTPNNHSVVTGGVTYLAECEGRSGVASFDGTGLLTAPARTLSPRVNDGVTAGYTFETWFYVDEWVKDAYIFRKENADASKGFSIRLGDEGQIFVRCDGCEYGANLSVDTKKWHHIGIVPRSTDVTRTTFLFVYDGVGKSATTSLCNGGTDCTPDFDGIEYATFGENFKGKLDNTVIWDMNFDATDVKNHSNEVMMPGFDIVLTSFQMQKANTCYLYDDPDNLGFSSYSQDNWRDIMMSAYEGYRGAQVRISVKSANGWQNCIANAEYRRNFAVDLGEIAKGYDGVELDLEWMDGLQTNLGLLAKEIRANLPEGKTFFVSCHAYGAYRFPLDDMEYVDGFTFQQYGPQPTFFQWNNFESSIVAFQNYGFEDGKIMASYSTTTSRGFQGDNIKEISGVKAGFFAAEDFDPEANSGEMNGYTYSFVGPMQTYKRAAYCVDHHLQGIFYWDMGNDLPVSHPYNLAKWCSYALNANVDRLVTSVEVRHGLGGVGAIISDPAKVKVTVTVHNSSAYVSGIAADSMVDIYSIGGQLLSRQPLNESKFDISSLQAGAYIARFSYGEGYSAAAKFIKNY